MAIPSNRTPVRVARGAAVKFTETIDGVAGAGAKALEDGEIVWDETNEKFQLKVGGSSSTTLKDHTVDTTNLAALSGAAFTGDVDIAQGEKLTLGGNYEIYEVDGSSELRVESTAGHMRHKVPASQSVLIEGPTGSIAKFNEGGACELYHDYATYSTPKLTTKTTGVEIAGTLEATNIGTTTFLDGVVVNWGTNVDGRISYVNSDNTFNIRCPGNTADIVIGTGNAGSGGSTKFTNGGGTVEYASFDNNGGLTVKKRAVGEITALTDAATIAVDFKDSNNFSVTLGDNRTLGQPSNQTAGQSGSIFVTQDGTGSRTLAYHADWKWAGGTAPTLSTAASSVDRIDYIVAAANKIHAVATLAVA